MHKEISLRIIIFFLFTLVLAHSFSGCSDKELERIGGIVGPSQEDWASLFDWSDPETWTNPAEWSDDKLRSFTYSGHHQCPGFFTEDYNGGSPSYVTEAGARIGDRRSIQLSATDRNTAHAWAETVAVNLLYYRDIESESETEKYFEFRRVYSENTIDIILSRVHKISYLDRSMYDRWNPTPVIGVFKVHPIVEENAQELIEYIWRVSRIVPFAHPLSRDIQETPSSFIEAIYFSYFIGGDWGTCDSIVFGLAQVAVDKETGEVTYTAEELREINGVCYE